MNWIWLTLKRSSAKSGCLFCVRRTILSLIHILQDLAQLLYDDPPLAMEVQEDLYYNLHYVVEQQDIYFNSDDDLKLTYDQMCIRDRNSKTPVPEGCEDLTAECEGCKITSCAHNPVLKQSKGENKE